nr:DUF262 domain-containing protein [Desulforhopalus vacuolatus]
MSLAEYYRKWEKGDLIIPDFQRQFVWNKSDASKLIESFLLGLPVPGVFLYKRREDNKFLVVDGQQRILSAIFFLKGFFKEKIFRLSNVEKPWDNSSFEDLTDADKRALEDSILRATIIQQLDPADDTSIYHIFERLNTGGKKLNPMEVRRCVYSGIFANKLEELNKNSNWRKIFGKEKMDLRFKDVELVLRILALAARKEEYEKPMKSFLTEFMKDNSRTIADDVQPLINAFEKVCAFVFEHLGDKPFHLKGRLNYAAIDCIMAVILRTEFESIPDDFKERFEILKYNENFKENVYESTSDTKSVEGRFVKAEEILIG